MPVSDILSLVDYILILAIINLLTIELVKKQDIGKCLKGSTIITKVIEVFIIILFNRTKNFLISRVFKLDNYKYLILYI